RFREVESVSAQLYKFVPTAREAKEEIAPLEFLRSIQRRDVLAFAGGESGVWTRFVAPYLGAPVLYGATGRQSGAPGQPTVDRICGDFGFPEMRTIEWVAGIVGNPVGHSLSPRLHNGAYRALGIPALFLPFQPENFGDFWLEVIEGGLFARMGWRFAALSVTAPFKSLAVAVAGAVSPLARAIDSANTLVSWDGVWEAESTDPSGVVGPVLWRDIGLESKRAAVVGCGGAGRAAAAGLAREGCRVTLVNRTVDRGREVAESLHLDFVGLEELEPSSFDILVNATSLGHGEDDPLPFEVDDVGSDGTVVDLVYGEQPTALAERCRQRDLVVVEGREVLLHLAIEQFRLMTGEDLPLELARRLLALEEAV
ncbi:MAG: type I 3-dehydroquinate dehydratase, partial [Acidobacteria bacterium]|nr:type I 3-dehydroquinate dehydratase [Acidobacteriota bacterium]